MLLTKLVAAPVLILVLHITATLTGWYDAIWWLDKPIHFFGGVAIAISSYYLIAHFKTTGQMHINWPWLNILVITAIVALCAVVWEFFEFYIDSIISIAAMQQTIDDTITDLVMGILGGMIVAFIVTWPNLRMKK